jgi:hypothetical protein
VAEDDELAELRALAGRLDPSVTWEEPPPDLFARIAAEAGVDQGGRPAVAAVPEEDAPSEPTVERTSGAEVRPLRRPRRNGTPWLLAAAAALVVVVAGGVWFSRAQEPTVLASAELELLGDSGSGQAQLIDDDGTLQLRVDTADLADPDGFVEVWVIDEEVSKLVSLGPQRPDGLYDLPEGLDPEAFPIVDLSFEPLDGDPQHSGDSVLRGQLEF